MSPITNLYAYAAITFQNAYDLLNVNPETWNMFFSPYFFLKIAEDKLLALSSDYVQLQFSGSGM